MAQKGTIALSGGKSTYGPSTLTGNWVEDRVAGPTTEYVEIPGFETTKGFSELSGANKTRKIYGLTLGAPRDESESKHAQSPLSLVSYQDPAKLDKPASISQLAYNPRTHKAFQDQFGSRFPLRTTPKTREELDNYRSDWSMDLETRERRFKTEKVHCDNSSVESQFRTSAMRDLPNVPVPVRNLRAAILDTHGTHAMHLMMRVFTAYDVDGSLTLSRDELLELLKDLGLRLTPDDFQVIWEHFDVDESGQIDYAEFQRAMRGPMSPERLISVQAAYDDLVAKYDGLLRLQDLLDAFVLNSRGLRYSVHLDCVSREFANQWVFLDAAAPVSADLFEEYFANLSAAVPDDGEFLAIIESAFSYK
ncbi:Calcyphosin [Hondaea fermentalgiana]|uniref:Calcyphosin n=1 Tax=Hondaea fermentalgiana TaxID=2315210 RepID=A0A2R5GBF8_9STRA|nr:Calcyphosin [Hondaea fermentalgiana]|eukprot:GBG28317.1 Calcyphosin [Hondaea fermentalgiana]